MYGFQRHVSHGEQQLVISEDVNWRRVSLNRPQALNSLNLSMVQELTTRMQQWEANPRVFAVIFDGLGGRAFCAGGDVKTLYERGSDPATREDAWAFFREEYQLNYHLATSATPVISLLDGVVMGGGVGLSVHGKVRDL